MGCLESKPEPLEPLLPDCDPSEIKFNEMFQRGEGVIPTRDVAKAMGLSAVTTGRLVSKWGYQVGRRYLDGKRERVVIGIKVI